MNRSCGTGVCGGNCGACSDPGEYCSENRCLCRTNCTGKQCGTDGCDGSCGNCAAGYTCNASQLCECFAVLCVDWSDYAGLVIIASTLCLGACGFLLYMPTLGAEEEPLPLPQPPPIPPLPIPPTSPEPARPTRFFVLPDRSGPCPDALAAGLAQALVSAAPQKLIFSVPVLPPLEKKDVALQIAWSFGTFLDPAEESQHTLLSLVSEAPLGPLPKLSVRLGPTLEPNPDDIRLLLEQFDSRWPDPEQQS